jgi:hypothetical protein
MERLSQDGGNLDEVGVGSDAVESLAEDEIIDFITGNPVKLKGNEEVRRTSPARCTTSTASWCRTWSGTSRSRCRASAGRRSTIS